MMQIPNEEPVPNSLALPLDDDAMADPARRIDGRKNRARHTTHEVRLRAIDTGKYQENDRYKQKDTKEALERVFNRKCAYCQRHLDGFHVEHYRPKDTYPWLAWSWDNLLFACDKCNTKKGDHFEIAETQVSYDSAWLEEIHEKAPLLNEQERPSLFHPCLEDPQPFFSFKEDGTIDSSNERAKYTIKHCGLDRKNLNHDRYAVIQAFEDHLNSALQLADAETASLIKTEEFMTDAFGEINSIEFQAFRQYIAEHFLQSIVNRITMNSDSEPA